MADQRQSSQWRQGCVLSVEHAKDLNVVHPKAGDDPITVVVSHDCDIAASENAEPECEIIPGLHIAELDGQFTNAKNPRRLHLAFSAGKVPASASFSAPDKVRVPKAALLSRDPAPNVKLNPLELDRLKTWLGIRYNRSSFPDEFDRRFKDKKHKAYKRFVEIIKTTGNHLQAVLLSVDQGAEVEREGPDDTYSLDIFLLWGVDDDPAAAEIAATKAAAEIKIVFEQAFSNAGQWKEIELRDCLPVSEAQLSIYECRCLQEWHFDYLSLEGDE